MTFAEKIGVNPAALSAIEKGRRPASQDVLDRIAKGLGLQGKRQKDFISKGLYATSKRHRMIEVGNLPPGLVRALVLECEAHLKNVKALDEVRVLGQAEVRGKLSETAYEPDIALELSDGSFVVGDISFRKGPDLKTAARALHKRRG